VNKKEIKDEFKSRGYSIVGWCRVHNVPYSVLYQLISSPTKPLYTRAQMNVIEALKKDGFKVKDE
jgi:hypothetical protein